MKKQGHKQNNDAKYLKEFATIHGSTDFSKEELQNWLKEKGLGPTARARIWKKHELSVKQHEFQSKQHDYLRDKPIEEMSRKEKKAEAKALARELGVGKQLDSWLEENTAFQDRCIEQGRAHRSKKIPDSAWQNNPAEAFWTAVGQVIDKNDPFNL